MSESEIIKTSIVLDKEMHDKFRIRCMTDQTTMSDKLRYFIKQYTKSIDDDFDKMQEKIPTMGYEELVSTNKKIKAMFAQLDESHKDRARKINDLLNQRNSELRGNQ